MVPSLLVLECSCHYMHSVNICYSLRATQLLHQITMLICCRLAMQEQMLFVQQVVRIIWWEVVQSFCVSILLLQQNAIFHLLTLCENKKILDATSGSTPDWAFGFHNTRLTYTLEVRPIRGSSNGFLLAPNQIIPNNREVFSGVRAMIAQARAIGEM